MWQFMFVFLFCNLTPSQAPKSKSVNVNLETVLEFDEQTLASDVQLIDNVQNFLNKVRDVLDNTQDYRRINNEENLLTMTEFLKNAIIIIKTYGDDDLQELLHLTDEEMRKYHYEGCKFYELVEDMKIRSYIADTLDTVRTMPLKRVRHFLDKFLKKLKTKKFTLMEKIILNYLDSLYHHSATEKMNAFLKGLEQYRARSKRSSSTLIKVVRGGIRSIIFDHYSVLHPNVRKDLKMKLSGFIGSDVNDKALKNKTSKNNLSLHKDLISTEDENERHKNHAKAQLSSLNPEEMTKKSKKKHKKFTNKSNYPEALTTRKIVERNWWKARPWTDEKKTDIETNNITKDKNKHNKTHDKLKKSKYREKNERKQSSEEIKDRHIKSKHLNIEVSDTKDNDTVKEKKADDKKLDKEIKQKSGDGLPIIEISKEHNTIRRNNPNKSRSKLSELRKQVGLRQQLQKRRLQEIATTIVDPSMLVNRIRDLEKEIEVIKHKIDVSNVSEIKTIWLGPPFIAPLNNSRVWWKQPSGDSNFDGSTKWRKVQLLKAKTKNTDIPFWTRREFPPVTKTTTNTNAEIDDATETEATTNNESTTEATTTKATETQTTIKELTTEKNVVMVEFPTTKINNDHVLVNSSRDNYTDDSEVDTHVFVPKITKPFNETIAKKLKPVVKLEGAEEPSIMERVQSQMGINKTITETTTRSSTKPTPTTKNVQITTTQIGNSQDTRKTESLTTISVRKPVVTTSVIFVTNNANFIDVNNITVPNGKRTSKRSIVFLSPNDYMNKKKQNATH